MTQPTFGFLMAVTRESQEAVQDSLGFLQVQRYRAWEAVVVLQSPLVSTRNAVNHFAYHDPRIRMVELGESVGASVDAAADKPVPVVPLQVALARATATYCALLPPGDLLAPRALATVAAWLREQAEVDVLYTDEDVFDVVEGARRHRDIFFKPPWSPDHLLNDDYTGGLTLWRRRVMEQVGGFRQSAEGADGWDMSLRTTELSERVGHIDEVLYHRSAIREEARRPLAAPRVLADALGRRGWRGSVTPISATDGYQVRRELESPPSISVVIPTAAVVKPVDGLPVRLVDRAIDGLLHHTAYAVSEVFVVLSAGVEDSVGADILERAKDDRVKVVRGRAPFSFSEAINQGTVRATGELLLLFNDDVWPLQSDWLSLLVEALLEDRVGVVGPRLFYADGRLQHAGVQHHNGLPFHAQRFAAGDDPGYHGEIVGTRNYLAVNGAVLATRRRLFEEVGGLSNRFPINYNDMDYCLKVRLLGWRTTYVGQARLVHYESASRSPAVSVDDVSTYLAQWRTMTDPDRYLPFPRVPANAP